MTVEIESIRVEDQTSDDWNEDEELGCVDAGHQFVSIHVGSVAVPYVERCEVCGFIEPSALTAHVENAIKNSMTQRAQRIAVAAETEPFAFVQSPGEDLELDEILGQALGAASMCWGEIEKAGEFDSTRAKSIFMGLRREIDRVMRLDREAIGLQKEEPNG